MSEQFVPGEVFPSGEAVQINDNRETATVMVSNTGDRPVQVGSHFHFFEVNAALSFDRETTFGMRLDIPAGTAKRFEPGDEAEVSLVDIGGDRIMAGMNSLVDGPLNEENKQLALERAKAAGFGGL